MRRPPASPRPPYACASPCRLRRDGWGPAGTPPSPPPRGAEKGETVPRERQVGRVEAGLEEFTVGVFHGFFVNRAFIRARTRSCSPPKGRSACASHSRDGPASERSPTRRRRETRGRNCSRRASPPEPGAPEDNRRSSTKQKTIVLWSAMLCILIMEGRPLAI